MIKSGKFFVLAGFCIDQNNKKNQIVAAPLPRELNKDFVAAASEVFKETINAISIPGYDLGKAMINLNEKWNGGKEIKTEKLPDGGIIINLNK
jgi:hypothetical protein